MKKCTNCGTENKDGAGFCGACGTPVEPAMRQEMHGANSYQNNQGMGSVPPMGNDQPYQNNQGMGGVPPMGNGQPYQNSQGMGGMPPMGNGQPYQNSQGMGGMPPMGNGQPYQNYNGQYTNQGYGAPGMGGAMPNMGPVNNCIRQAGSSTLFLVACILSTLGAAFTIIFSGLAATSAIGLLPSILFIIGVWMFYTASKNGTSSLTKGITLIKSSTIITIVALFLAVAVTLIILLIINAAVGSIAGSNEATSIILAVIIALCIVLAFPIVAYFIILKALNSIKKTIETNTVVLNGVSFLTVMLYITSILGILGSLSNIAMIGTINTSAYEALYMLSNSLDMPIDQLMTSLQVSWMTVIGGLLTSSSLLLFGIVLSKAKKALKGNMQF